MLDMFVALKIQVLDDSSSLRSSILSPFLASISGDDLAVRS